MLRSARLAGFVVGTLVVQAIVSGPLAARQSNAGTTDVVRSLAGFWKAAELKVAASSELDVQVWGRDASKVRNVDLALEPTGEGVLRVHSSVVDARGRTKPFSASVIEARLAVTPPAGGTPGALIEPQVKVVSAQERYLDGSMERRTIDGLAVKIIAMAADSREINIRFDTAQGHGSFGETLKRRAAPKPAAAGKPAS